MAFKDDIEALCLRAVKYKKDVVVRLPKPPLGWTKHQADERFFQLSHLIKLYGCEIEQVNNLEYKIFAPQE